ncbi:ABC transporter permease [Aeromicrobium fastidiosum]|uniref:FtsX-like permease family protein n=1 Tax=Aeromicrobium fastidiosum TaxID=52699 RepID=A0A641AIE4_9ACTN|nr:FtsX-like permease family protein [Aeromicrobium fastidiosum]KAA1373745.1 FtsX-like permease family protein [Aeromicrobium fastidiosum]MBP2391310.1 putative ABC transport system permease protein [Aeromicrobium fastidiosum]
MRTVILASMRTYARRYVAALVAVVIATAFIVAINALSSAARAGSAEAVDEQYGAADLVVPGTGNVEELGQKVARVSAVPGVRAVAVNWSAYGSATLPDGPRDISLGSVATASALRWQHAATGRLPRTDDEVAVSSSDAAKHDIATGSTITLNIPGGDRRLTVTGTVDDPAASLSATAYLPEKAFAGLGDAAFPVDAVAATDRDTLVVAETVNRELGADTVTIGDTYRERLRLDATRGIDVFQKLIYVFAGISLFVGALVIANTFTILLAQRARDLALLRCVGAVRSQVARSVVLEGVVLGAVGAVTGVLLGLGIAMAGVALIGRLSPDTPMGWPSLTPLAASVPIALGVAVTAAGAYLPAQRAGAQSPLSALQPQDVVEIRSRSGAVRLVSASTLVVLGGGGLVAGLGGSLPVGMVGGMLSFVGLMLLTPVIVPAAIRLTGPIVRRLGLAGRLAHANSLRNPRRTAATSTALLIGVTLITAVVVGSASVSHKVNTSLDKNNPVDLMVTSSTAPVPDRVADEIRRVDGVDGVATLPGRSVRVGAQDLDVLGVDQRALGLIHGTPDFGRLGPDEIVLPYTVDGVKTSPSGDTVEVSIAGQIRDMKVLYGTGLGDQPLVSTKTLESMGATGDGTRAVWVRADPSADATDVVGDVTAVARTADLDVTGGLPDRADILKTLDVVMAVTIGLLAIAVLIALVGVGNTLSLSVLERVRESSLLRALGLGRSGLRAMLAIEALLMAGVAAVLGVALGTAYAWFGVRTTSVGVFNTEPGLTMPWGQIATILAVAALAGLVACVLPARRAARIPPAAGLVAD